ncbi:MAG: polysaccharide biosynthesis/export family protein [Planctomycetes bacterium]|nr:polysaccharide biosynthesis/export family protein [Planctomycetota bacterium]
MLAAVVVITASGCYAPLRSPGVPASALPDHFRMPMRAVGPPLNYAMLTAPPPRDYFLGPGDVLSVTVPDLFPNAVVQPLQVQVMASGEVYLPLIGAVRVGGMNLLQAQQVITRTYADGYFTAPRVSVSLALKSTVEVVVLGEVNAPGTHPLPRFQNDVGHALAAAAGLNRLAADMVEVHRRRPALPGAAPPICDESGYPVERSFDPITNSWLTVMRIPLRGAPPGPIPPSEILLQPGDVVLAPSRESEVFFVVGELNPSNLVRFTLGDRERELGAGLVLPREREIDVVTAVAMAGYIDPIESPTTVTVHRVMPDGKPLLILVDLIAARYDPQETVLVRPGDIIYLNPDPAWWFRRTFDRVVPTLITSPYTEAMGRWINPRNNNN